MVTSDATVLGVQRTLSFPIINSCQVIIRHLIPVLYKNKDRTYYQQQSHKVSSEGIGTPLRSQEPFINTSTVLHPFRRTTLQLPVYLGPSITRRSQGLTYCTSHASVIMCTMSYLILNIVIRLIPSKLFIKKLLKIERKFRVLLAYACTYPKILVRSLYN